jgi:hypothetical protein
MEKHENGDQAACGTAKTQQQRKGRDAAACSFFKEQESLKRTSNQSCGGARGEAGWSGVECKESEMLDLKRSYSIKV